MSTTMTFAERLNKALEYSNKKRIDLAAACGVSRAAVTQWTNGSVDGFSKTSYASAAAKFLGVSLQWLAEGKGEMLDNGIAAIYQEEDIPAGFVEIPEYRVECGAGHRDAPTFEVATDSKRAIYRREWFEERHLNPEKCKRLKVHGDSMVPILFDGDSILCDCSVTHIVSGKIYAFCFGDEVRVKRLFTKLNGGLIVHSENPQERDEEISPDEMDLFYLVGRVVDRSGSGPF